MEEKLKKVILTLLVIVTHFFANDGYGALGAGGIIIGKTDDIAMAKEVLEISYNKIKVSYEFINESDKDITETIVFPLPEFQIGVGIFSDHDSYLKMIDSFKVVVDGKPVTFETKVRTVISGGELKGQDITDKLLKLGFSERDIIASEDNFDDIIVPKAEILEKNGLCERNVENDEVYVRWTNHITYEWRQTFKAHQKVKISHEYRPLIGGGFSYSYHCSDSYDQDMLSELCMPKQGLKALKDYCLRYYDSFKTNDYLNRIEVSYILKTANTWKDGIRDFKLIIQKKPHEVVSSCFPAPLRQTTAYTYGTELKNFKPEEDLKIYFINIFWDDVESN